MTECQNINRKKRKITNLSSPNTSALLESESNETNYVDIKESKLRCSRKKLLGCLFLVFIILIIVDSTTTRFIASSINGFLEWIESHPILGLFGFIAIYVVCTVLFIPASILTVGAGFAFSGMFGLGIGLLLGSLTVFLGASIGAILAFLIGRYLLRDCVKGLSRKYVIFEALDVAFKEKGFRIMLLLRLSPIIPFNVIDYAASITAVSFRDYTLALIGIIPGVMLYVFLGASAGSLAEGMGGTNTTLTIVVIVVGVIFGVAAVAVTSYYAKKELNQVIASRQSEVQTSETHAVEQDVTIDDEDNYSDTESSYEA
mmetsp:Transcript_26005/g.38428  ORF Transcript_26005/g.38428 Transcript_26005/m.38428 type:complete len:315 (-) Transcript_26005:74-1018(-)